MDLKEIATTLATCVLAAALVGAVGCSEPYYGNNINSGYNPDPGYSRRYIPGGNGGYASKWDYYRNYNGAFHTPPEQP